MVFGFKFICINLVTLGSSAFTSPQVTLCVNNSKSLRLPILKDKLKLCLFFAVPPNTRNDHSSADKDSDDGIRLFRILI